MTSKGLGHGDQQPFVLDSDDIRESECHLVLSGDLDLAAAALLRQAIDVAFSRGRHHVSVDAEAVSFIDSAGLMVLLEARSDLTDAGGTLRLSGASQPVKRILEIAMLSDELLDTSGDGRRHRPGDGQPGGQVPPSI